MKAQAPVRHREQVSRMWVGVVHAANEQEVQIGIEQLIGNGAPSVASGEVGDDAAAAVFLN